MRKLTHASLESGFGGFDLAAEQAGFENIFQCEIDPFCQTILKYHFPNAKLYGDIRGFNATPYLGQIDILSAGFPCQPFSQAGKQLGVEDERFIWPENIRIIRECQPSWVILENVVGITGVYEPTSIAQMETETPELFHQNKTQTNIHERVIKRIIHDIIEAGYILPTSKDGTPIVYCVPACGVDAPHRRDRIFFIAYRGGERCHNGSNSWKERFFRDETIRRDSESTPNRAGRFVGFSPIHEPKRQTITDPNKIRCRSSAIRRKRNENTRSRIFGAIEGFRKGKFTPNNQGRNDSKHIRKPTKRQKQQPRKPTEQDTATNRNNRFSIYTKKEICSRWVAFVVSCEYIDTNSKKQRLQIKRIAKLNSSERWKAENRQSKQSTSNIRRTLPAKGWQNFPTQPPLCGGNDGIPPRLDSITFSKWRIESIKGYGNAVVPPLIKVFFDIIKKIIENEPSNNK